MSNQAKIQRTLELLLMLNCKYGRSIDEISSALYISRRTAYRYIDTIKNAGFIIDKKESQGKYFYRINSDNQHGRDISDLLHFTKEEAYILSKAIHSIDQENELKIKLIKKLYSLYDFDRVSVPIIKKENSEVIHRLTEAINNKQQVVLKDYHSSNRGEIYDRLVEPFGFTTNFVAVWCFDTVDNENKIYKTSRIGNVLVQETPWNYENQHQDAFIDVFRISSFNKIPVKLTLSLLARNLLVEEYPLAEQFITQKSENSYVFETEVASLAGVGRFVMGLIDEIEIHQPESLNEYIRKKINKARLI
ncbi:MAG: helix-turn-helix transcriptional regulator [Bacteroidota bacterium]